MKVYDNGEETFDRYTIMLAGGVCMKVSDNPDGPDGYSQVTLVAEGPHLGEGIDFEDLPDDVQKHIMTVLTDSSKV